MIAVRAQVTTQVHRVKRAADRSAFKNVRHAAATIRITARRSIRKRKGPSAAGRPPHTHAQGKSLRKAIAYDVEQSQLSALVGPLASVVGEAGEAHEFGGEFRGDDYPERPFMGPALQQNQARFASDWAGSFGE